VEDIAAGSMLTVEHIRDATPVNLGWDKRYKIKDVAMLILELSGHHPEKIFFNSNKPEGPFSRALDISRAKNLLLWEPKVDLEEGLERTIAWHMRERKMPLTPEIIA
jgi:nucleoside-diphosphate-sugar epimerase